MCLISFSFLSMNMEWKHNILPYRHPVDEFKILKYHADTWSIGLYFTCPKSRNIFFIKKNHLGRRHELSKQKLYQRRLPCTALSRQETKLTLWQFHRKIVKNKLRSMWIAPGQVLNINQRMSHQNGGKMKSFISKMIVTISKKNTKKVDIYNSLLLTRTIFIIDHFF